jgi:hypothetical protein
LIVIVLAGGFHASGESSPAITKDYFAIDYSHEVAGVFYHGTLTFVDNTVGVIWTTEDQNGKKTQSVPMTEDTFRTVWESFNKIEDFRNGLVKDEKTQLDFRACHVIGISFKVGAQTGLKAYMVPGTGISPEFKKWLEEIGYKGP